MDPAIGVIDVGSPKKKNIGWSIRVGDHEEHGSNLDAFIEAFSRHAEQRPALLGFEAPLFVPHGRRLMELTAQRAGENGRPWSAAPGATVAVTGLVVATYTLAGPHAPMWNRSAVLDWRAELSPADLLVFEAFVSGTNHTRDKDHWKDAKAVTDVVAGSFPDLDRLNSVKEANVLSLLEACLLRTGWVEPGSTTLSRPCLVVRP